MNVLILSPGYPAEMPAFTRGLAEVGATVFGAGDQHPGSLSETVRSALTDYVHVPSLWDAEAAVRSIRNALKGHRFDRIECLWEPGVLLAAQLREALGVEGLTVEKALWFRDKEQMKLRLDAAGIRTPRHTQADSVAACWEAAESLGFPLILKPIAGAGSADTYRIDDKNALRAVLPKLRHVPLVSAEEFIDGEEFTFDTITINGEIAYFNIAVYRPRPLIARTNEWISPQVVALRDVDKPHLADGIKMGYEVIKALEFDTGFTHMEWYRKQNGEVVFGEIGARPPGAHQVDQMKYACDFDVFKEWGRAVAQQKIEKYARNYNVANIYKRAQGIGRIHAIQGWREIERELGEHMVWNNLLPIGSRRRDWRQTLVSDGFVMLRHPDLETTLEMADRIGSDVHLYAN